MNLADPTDARFTAAQREQLEAFEGAPTPPEVREAAVIAAVTEALLITVLGTDDRDFLAGCDLPADEIARLIVEYGAAAAVAAYRAAQDGGEGYDLATDLANQGLRSCCGQPSAEHCR